MLDLDPDIKCREEDKIEAYFANKDCKKEALFRNVTNSLKGSILGAELQRTSRVNGASLIRYACITPSLLDDSIRITYYDEDGLEGDSSFKSAEDALKEAISNGFSTLAEVSFDTLALTSQFQEGNERFERMRKEFAKKR